MQKLLALFAFLALSQMAFAQLEIRPQVGVNSSTLTKDISLGSFDSDQGLQFGADLIIGNRFYVQPGIMWESVKNRIQPGGEDEELNFKINRVRVPLLVGYKIFPSETGRYFNIRLFTGPNASFAINKDVEDNNLSFDKDDIKGSVFGWNAGAGLDIAVLFVDFGYTFGLSDVFKGLDGNPRNNLFYANGGLRIRF